MIGIKASETEGLQERFAFEKNVIFSAAKDRGQNGSCVMIDRMPQPALVALLADKAPHLVDLSFPSLLNVHDDLIGVHGAQQRRASGAKRSRTVALSRSM